MITTRDIAERLGISVSTVGRALADDARISEETKFRVRQTASEMGYVGNRAARMMRGASSNVVALVIPDIRNSFYSTIAHELSKNMAAEGFQLMLSETDDDRMVELRHLRELSANRVAGVIIVPTARPHSESVKLLRAVPHLQLLRRHPSLGSQWFGVDDREALHRATAHLVSLGHTRIAYLGGPEELPTGAERLSGFRAALEEAGLADDAGRTELGPPSSVHHGREAVRRLLQEPAAPTALVLGSIQLTLGVLEELSAQGVKVPGELSVVGFGDDPGFSWWGPGLTTIGLPIQEMATSCALWLLRRLKNEPENDGPYTSVSPGSLVLRGSTAPPAERLRPSPPERVAPRAASVGSAAQPAHDAGGAREFLDHLLCGRLVNLAGAEGAVVDLFVDEGDAHGRPDRQHPEIGHDLLGHLHRPGARRDAAVADERRRLVLPLHHEVVPRVLQGSRKASVVLGGDEHERVRRVDDPAPGKGVALRVLPQSGRMRLIEERKVEFAQVDQV